MYTKNSKSIARRVQLTQHKTNSASGPEVVAALHVWEVQDRLDKVIMRAMTSPNDVAIAETVVVADAKRNSEEKTLGEIVDDLAAVNSCTYIATATIMHHVQGHQNPELHATGVYLANVSSADTKSSMTELNTLLNSLNGSMGHSTYLQKANLAQGIDATSLM